MNPLISVIVPVYNTEKLLKKCVDSILAQTYKDFELFLVDDGSTDSCPTICDDYALADSRVKVIHKTNEGQGVARNMALDAASGKYISFIDSDDWVVQVMLEKLLNAAETHSADIAICGLAVFNGLRLADNSYFKDIKVYDNRSLMKDYISTPYIHTGPCNKIFRRFLFDTIRFPNIRAREDAFIMHELLGQCKTGVHVGECLYIQFVRQGSTELSKFSLNKLVLLECAKRLQQYILENYPDLYEYVALKYANEIVYIMGEIINSFSYNRFKNEYKQLKDRLIEERKRLVEADENAIAGRMSTINQVCDHSTMFYIKNIYLGIKRRLKRHLLKALDLISRKTKNIDKNIERMSIKA